MLATRGELQGKNKRSQGAGKIDWVSDIIFQYLLGLSRNSRNRKFCNPIPANMIGQSTDWILQQLFLTKS